MPSVERLLTRPLAVRLSSELGRDRVRDLIREIVADLRARAGNGNSNAIHPDLATDAVERELEIRAARAIRGSIRRVVNATGVIIHTNLGRAPLAPEAINAVAEAAAGYTNIEYNLECGERGQRDAHCRELLTRATRAEAAIVVNNNAAAVLLILNALAEGGEVIVSRGELIEIGGSFRIPDVMAKSGARLVEVGTTNRTRIADYERAINERTRLLMRVHPSNYKIVGFTERPNVEEISELARERGIPSYEDLGSGCLIDLTPFGVQDEPVVASSISAGISIVSFSGDKMLGGPQAGIIAGSRELVERVRQNPLMRALRVDKLTYAALEATLGLYERKVAQLEVPVIRALGATVEELHLRARTLAGLISEGAGDALDVSLEDGHSVIGGGSAPEVGLPTVLISVRARELSPAALETSLRSNEVPVIARTERDRLLLDLRTVSPAEEPTILAALVRAAQPAPGIAASVD